MALDCAKVCGRLWDAIESVRHTESFGRLVDSLAFPILGYQNSRDWLVDVDPTWAPERSVSGRAETDKILSTVLSVLDDIQKSTALSSASASASAMLALPLSLLTKVRPLADAARSVLVTVAEKLDKKYVKIVQMYVSVLERMDTNDFAKLDSDRQQLTDLWILVCNMKKVENGSTLSLLYPLLKIVLADGQNYVFTTADQMESLRLVRLLSCSADASSWERNDVCYTLFDFLEYGSPSLFHQVAEAVQELVSCVFPRDVEQTQSGKNRPNVVEAIASGFLSSKSFTVQTSLRLLSPLLPQISRIGDMQLLRYVVLRLLFVDNADAALETLPKADRQSAFAKMEAENVWDLLAPHALHENFVKVLGSCLEQSPKAATGVLACIIETARERIAEYPEIMRLADASAQDSENAKYAQSILVNLTKAMTSIATTFTVDGKSCLESFASLLMDHVTSLTDVLVSDAFVECALAVLQRHLPAVLGTPKDNHEDLVEIYGAPLNAGVGARPVARHIAIAVRCLAEISILLPAEHPSILYILDYVAVSFEYDCMDEEVQQICRDAVSNLFRHIRLCGMTVDVSGLLEDFYKAIVNPQTSAQRKQNACLGVCAVVHGLGVRTLVSEGLMDLLSEPFKKKKKKTSGSTAEIQATKSGCLAIAAALWDTMGSRLEPFLDSFLDLVLKGTADVSTETLTTSIVSRISTFGAVKLLDIVVAGLSSDLSSAWKAKVCLLDMIGRITTRFPSLVAVRIQNFLPALLDALVDSHDAIQEAASKCLQRIGGTVQTPELRVLVPVLVNAYRVQDHVSISLALSSVIQTRFRHNMDGPAVAYLIPLIMYSLRYGVSSDDVGSIVHASLVISVVPSLASSSAGPVFAFCLSDLLGQLQKALYNLVPACRSASAKALGSVFRYCNTSGLGKPLLDDLRNDMLSKLDSAQGGFVERVGVAEGLVELMDQNSLRPILKDTIIPKAAALNDSTRTSSKEAYLLYIGHLPKALHQSAADLISECFFLALSSAISTNEVVQKAAVKACQEFLLEFVPSSPGSLVPGLEQGLFHSTDKLRLFSIEFLGDVLRRTAKHGSEDAQAMSPVGSLVDLGLALESEETQELSVAIDPSVDTVWIGKQRYEKIREAHFRASLGEELTDRFICICLVLTHDSAIIVRNSATLLWKCMVTNPSMRTQKMVPAVVRFIVAELLVPPSGGPKNIKLEIGTRTLEQFYQLHAQQTASELGALVREVANGPHAAPPIKQGICTALMIVQKLQNDFKEYVLQFVARDLLKTVCPAFPV
eukprot:ANDGO_08099.mRNA.1 eIF-2-alpha kinase activator GCN1